MLNNSSHTFFVLEMLRNFAERDGDKKRWRVLIKDSFMEITEVQLRATNKRKRRKKRKEYEENIIKKQEAGKMS